MFIEFVIDGVKARPLIHIDKASSIAYQLDKRNKKWRLGSVKY